MSRQTLAKEEFACRSKQHLFHCENCGKEASDIRLVESDLQRQPPYHGAELFCSPCHASWFLCVTCEDIRSRWNVNSLYSHKTKKHPKVAPPPSPPPPPPSPVLEPMDVSQDAVLDLSYLPDAEEDEIELPPSAAAATPSFAARTHATVDELCCGDFGVELLTWLILPPYLHHHASLGFAAECDQD